MVLHDANLHLARHRAIHEYVLQKHDDFVAARSRDTGKAAQTFA